MGANRVVKDGYCVGTGSLRVSPSLIPASHPVKLRGLFPYAAILRLRGTASRSRGYPQRGLRYFANYAKYNCPGFYNGVVA